MEAADTVYGVTMEENGISKIIIYEIKIMKFNIKQQILLLLLKQAKYQK